MTIINFSFHRSRNLNEKRRQGVPTGLASRQTEKFWDDALTQRKTRVHHPTKARQFKLLTAGMPLICAVGESVVGIQPRVAQRRQARGVER